MRRLFPLSVPLIALTALLASALSACGDNSIGQCVESGPVEELALAEVLDDLEGLPFDAFLDTSYLHLLRRSPETVTIYGLQDIVGLGNDRLDDASDDYALRTFDLVDAILAQLRTFDRTTLTPAQQVSYDSYEWYLQDRAEGRDFLHFDYTSIMNVYSSLYTTLVIYHPLDTLEDAQGYLARVRQISRVIEQVRAAVSARETQGIVAPAAILARQLDGIEYLSQTPVHDTAFYQRFALAVDQLPTVPQSERQALKLAVEQALTCHLQAGFQDLEQDMYRLLDQAPSGTGASQYPGGDAYYAHRLRHHTTTDMTADEIHQLGLDELALLHAQMDLRFDALGYPPDESLEERFGRLQSESGTLQGSQAINRYRSLLETAESRLAEAFHDPVAAPLEVVQSNGDYYVSASADGSRPGTFHAYVGVPIPTYGMPTLAYHEGLPGHHYQISLAQDLDLPIFRFDPPFTAYIEGWAHYTENLASEIGWYDGDPAGDLGRLQALAFRAARLVVDTGLHDRGWSRQQAIDFMLENIGFARWEAEGQVDRYIGWPGQATAYWIGFRAMGDLRQRAIDQLGGAYDLRDFHSAVLTYGALPLGALDRHIQDYIDESTGQARRPAVASSASRWTMLDHSWQIRRQAAGAAIARQRARPLAPEHCAIVPKLRGCGHSHAGRGDLGLW